MINSTAKALELFLGLVMQEATKVTLERGAKKVEAYHLKHAIEKTETLDFLKEILETIVDPSAGGTIDLEGENGEGKKKRGKGKKAGGEAPPLKRRRKRKTEGGGEEVEGGVGEGRVSSEDEE